jgi:hypothetical protein
MFIRSRSVQPDDLSMVAANFRDGSIVPVGVGPESRPSSPRPAGGPAQCRMRVGSGRCLKRLPVALSGLKRVPKGVGAGAV